MEFVVRCFHKDGDDNVIGAEVVVYDGDGDAKKIVLTDETLLDELISRLDNLDSKYVSVDELVDFLINNNQSHTINASLFNGMASDMFLKKTDTTTYTFKPMHHESPQTTYGVGDESNYGHVKVIDNTNYERPDAGVALSAHQGFEINKRLNNIESNSLKGSLRLFVGRYSDKGGEYGTRVQVPPTGDGIYVRAISDLPGFDYTKLFIVIDFADRAYEFKASNSDANRKIYPDENGCITGRLGVTQAPGSQFIVSVFATYAGNVLYPATTLKRVEVINNG